MRLATGSTRKCCLVTQLDSPDGHRRRLDCARVFHDNAHGFLLGELLGAWDLIWSTWAAADKGVSLPVRVRVRAPGDSRTAGFGLLWGDSVLWGDGSGIFPLSILGQGDR